MAKEMYPEAKISIEAVRDFVQHCPLCQKTRDTGIRGLTPKTLSLKPPTYRRTVGIDHLTVTPADKHGNCVLILVVEHFSHYPMAYAAKDYSAETVAIALFKHYCHHGMFQQLASDPGSAFMSEVVQQLNKWLGVYHKVSLVGRHQSNGTEATGKQYIRHLRTLVNDLRLYDRWSDDTVLPLINLHLQSYPTKETGYYTPLQLKFGTEDAAYFKMPEELELSPGVKAASIIKSLDENLRIVREISRKFQSDLAAERAAKDRNISQFEPGDLILFNQREKPSDHLPTKLSSDWLGPYEVISHMRNSIKAVHVVTNAEQTFHVERVKPFFGTYEQAVSIARHDQHQYIIISINSYTGNPFMRQSMTFNVTFEDGTIDMPYGGDFIYTTQFKDYITSIPSLYPLRFTRDKAIQNIRNINKLSITSVRPNMEAFVDIRIYDGTTSSWFDSLNLPDKTRPYIMPIRFMRWYNRSNHRMIEAIVPLFGKNHQKYTLYLTEYDLMAYVYLDRPYWTTNLLEPNDLVLYPQLLKS